MTYRKMMTVFSMAFVLIGASTAVQAEDGSLKLRTMLADRHGYGLPLDERKGNEVKERKQRILNNDELFLKMTEKSDPENR
ncbi:hypothetical protein HG264_00900 [Pseudomonas sp. gcc21]|uniref:hypothetical protein n=1 Tax=Pseudomonas sp. gcc21 TaxID=2726989 RepID=UPI00145285D8|nr:hypothetical protein [Pseudomonas sp. gcc21]QJD57566.1 hypothetical protein HG264_00900 [Pseudomonas sp. gcc21]